MQERRIDSVDSPIGAWPKFTFDHEPSIREMRETAVLAMHRTLSVQWFTEEPITLTTSVSKRTFHPYVKYAGIPYTGPNTSIFGFLQFLDEKTGRLKVEELKKLGYPDASTAFNKVSGSSCSGAVGWAVSTVCNSIRGRFQCYYMVPKNGWLKLGPYEYDTSIDEFGHDSPLSTDEILEMNGREVMYESYKLLQPGDIVVWQDRKRLGHTMMAIGPVVLNYRKEDGALDDERSYVFVQDQRPGGFQTVDDRTGALYRNMGRVNCKYSLKMLYDEGYIPATTAEFQGLKPFEKAWVKIPGERQESRETLKKSFLESNYPIAHVKLSAGAPGRVPETVRQYAFTRDDVRDGVAYRFPLAEFAEALFRPGVLSPGENEITLTATLPSGEQVTAARFTETAD